LLRQADDLEAQLKLARGTREIAPLPKSTTATRIELALRERVLTLDELAHAIGETASKTAAALRPLRKNLGNVGTPARARWIWRVGDRASPESLRASLLALITDQPLTTGELVAATGARASRVSGELVAIQRSGAQVLNLGTKQRHRWFVIPAGAGDARLALKGAK